MEKTDRQTDGKTSRWSFTAFKEQWHLFTSVTPVIVAEIGWQKEICPDTQREHYQGYIRTSRQVRFAQLAKLYPGVHLEPARNWSALLEYCRKTESAVVGTQVHKDNTSVTTNMSMNQAMIQLAMFCPYLDCNQLGELAASAKLQTFMGEVYWKCVRRVLKDYPEQLALYTQPQYQRAWINLYKVFLDQAETICENTEWEFPEDEEEECVCETDRQTDRPAFLLAE